MPSSGASLRHLAASSLAILCALAATPAVADDPHKPPPQEDGLPVIEANREAQIQALFTPYKLGSEPAPGWFLDSLTISATAITAKVVDKTSQSASISLELPKRKSSPETTPSFAVHRTGADKPGAAAALDALVTAVRANDKGGFWPAEAPKPGPSGEAVTDDMTRDETGAPAGETTRAVPSFLGKSRRRLVLAGALVIVVALLLLGRRGPGQGKPGGDSERKDAATGPTAS